jgi:hypothetical protein
MAWAIDEPLASFTRIFSCDRSRHQNRQGYTLTTGSGCLTIGVHLSRPHQGRWCFGKTPM